MSCPYPTDLVEVNRSILMQLGAYSAARVCSSRTAAGESDAPMLISEVNERSSNQRIASQKRIKVLSVGDDPDLLETRGLVLTSVGYDVTSQDTGEVLETRPFTRFDGMIICHSTPEMRAILLASLMRRAKPQAPVIRLSMVPWPVPDSFTAVCGTMHSPVRFVADMRVFFADRAF